MSGGRFFNEEVNSDHEAAVKSVQEFGLQLRDTAEFIFEQLSVRNFVSLFNAAWT